MVQMKRFQRLGDRHSKVLSCVHLERYTFVIYYEMDFIFSGFSLSNNIHYLQLTIQTSQTKFGSGYIGVTLCKYQHFPRD